MPPDKNFQVEAEFPVITGLASHDDVDDVLRLQNENLRSRVPDEEKESQGYLSLETPPELLTQIIDDEGIIVAKAGFKIIGYLIPMTLERAKTIPFFAPMIEQFKSLQLDEKSLDKYKLCILAQICIDKSFRGSDALVQIHNATNNHLKNQYDLGVTEISDINKRSLQANVEKVGMIDAGQFESGGVIWHVVVTDFRKFRESKEMKPASPYRP